MDPVRVDLAPLLRYRDRLSQGLAAGAGDGNPVRRAFRQWAHIYRAFLRERYNRFSRGGGDWKPLAESTILGRKAKGGGTRRQKVSKAGRTIRTARKTLANASQRLDKLILKGKGDSGRANLAWFQIRRAAQRIAKARGTAEAQASMAGISILRDKGLLFNVTAPEFTGAIGQLQEDIPFGVRVGFGGPGRHPDGTATIADIAGFHQEGGPRLPQRKIIVPPDEPAQGRMARVMDAALKTLAGEA